MVDSARENPTSSGTITGYEGGRTVPPPPAGPSLASRTRDDAFAESGDAEQGSPAPTPRPKSRVFPFDAELEMADYEHGKAGLPWTARARTLSTSTLSLSSRRMCYVDRNVIVAVHRLDDEPTILMGRVVECRYEADGLHTIDLDLLPADDSTKKMSFTRKVA